MTPSAAVDVSVIVVTRNTCALLCAALRSIRASRDHLTKEVVVVDNGSTDATGSAVQREFPEVTYHHSDTNLGFARANNLGARDAQGEFILLLNSDARLNPEALGEAVNWMRQHPDCGVAGAQLLNPDGSRQNSIANLPTLATELLNKSLLRRLFPRRFPGKEQQFREPLEVESVVGAFLLVRRTLWQAVGGFDESYFFFLEETDLCLQARKLGLKVMHLPQVLVWHDQGQSARQMPASARIEYWRSRYAYFRKNHPSLTRSLLQFGLWFRLFLDWFGSGILVVVTLGQAPRPRAKWKVTTALWRWHLLGRPVEMGLPR
jgi:GT2 family glycosyltransferase